MAKNRFKDFLKEGQPFGGTVDLHFVNDALKDQNLPDGKSWKSLSNYIKVRNLDVKMLNPEALDEVYKAARHVWEIFHSTHPIITPDELYTLLNRRRYQGERIKDKHAIRYAAEEIERLRMALLSDQRPIQG